MRQNYKILLKDIIVFAMIFASGLLLFGALGYSQSLMSVRFGIKLCLLRRVKMQSDAILVGNLLVIYLEELNLSDFHGIYRFLPVLTEILEKIHFSVILCTLLGIKLCL